MVDDAAGFGVSYPPVPTAAPGHTEANAGAIPTPPPLPHDEDSTAIPDSLVDPTSPSSMPEELRDLPMPAAPPAPPRLADLMPPGMTAAGLRDLADGGEAAALAAKHLAESVNEEAAEMQHELLIAAGSPDAGPAGPTSGDRMAHEAAKAASAFAMEGGSSHEAEELLHGAQAQAIGGAGTETSLGDEGKDSTSSSNGDEGDAKADSGTEAEDVATPEDPPAPFASPKEAARMVDSIRKSAELALKGAEAEIITVRARLQGVRQSRKEVTEALAGRAEADQLADEARRTANAQDMELARIDKAMELHWSQCSDGRFVADSMDCLTGQTVLADKSVAV